MLAMASTSHAEDKKAVKSIQSIYQTIESGYKNWQTARFLDLVGAERQVWRSDDEPPLYRVSMQLDDDHAASTDIYYLKGEELVFMLDDYETNPHDNETKLTRRERRYYFAEGELIHALEKSTTYPRNKPVKLDSLPIKTLDLAKLIEDESAGDLHARSLKRAQTIANALETFDPEGAPEVTDRGTAGLGWRMIEGSASRYKSFILAWGIEGKDQPEGEWEEDGTLTGDPAAEGLVNYIVNLQTGDIIGKTEGAHASDHEMNSLATVSNTTVWAESSEFVAQLVKGRTGDALFGGLYQIIEGARVSKGVDILAASTKAALKGKKASAEAFVFRLHDVQIATRGEKTVLLVGVDAEGEKEEDSFDSLVTFQITAGAEGAEPKLTVLNTEFFK